MGRKRASSDGPDNYEADGGFVVNSGHEGGSLPVSKRAKSEKKTKLSKAKGGLDDLEGGAKRDGDDVYWEVHSAKRRVGGKRLIDSLDQCKSPRCDIRIQGQENDQYTGVLSEERYW